MSEGSGLTPEEHWLRFGRYPYLLAKLCTWALVGAALLWAVRSVENVLFPVASSLLLAYLLDPTIDRFEARGWSRTSGILLFLGVGAAFVGGFVLFLSPTVAHLVDRVGEVFPRLADLVQHDLLPRIRALAGDRVPADLDALVTQYGDTAREALPTLANAVKNAVADLWARTGAVVSSVLNLVLVPILTFYFLRDFDEMRLAAVDYLPAHNRPALLERIARMDEVVGAWFRGQIEVALILAGLYAVGLGITMGLSGVGFTSGLAVGVLSGLLNVVPYFGFLVGILFSTLLVLLDWNGWMPLVGVWGTFAVVQALEGYVVTPRIVGEKVGVSPVVVIIALLVGGELLGVLGVVLALPLAGIARVLLPDLVAWYQASDVYTGHVRRRPTEPAAAGAVGGGGAAAPETNRATPAAAGQERTDVVVADGVRGSEPRAGDPVPPGGPGGLGGAGGPVPAAGEPGRGGGRVPDGGPARSEPGAPPAADAGRGGPGDA